MYQLKNVKYKNIIDISELNIPNNKITCIVGKSGGGKTTLLKLLNKLISPDKGEITFDEQDLKTIDAVALRRNVGMLPQSPTIFTGNIRDNLLIGLKFSEKPTASDERLLEVLKLVHLNKELNDNAEKLSGGEKQRLALGRILLLNPEVLLLDEPSSALDEETENILIEKIIEFTKKNNKTLVMITHSKNVAYTFGDNIIEIEAGKVVEVQL